MKGMHILIMLALIATTGCATLFSGSDEEITFTSDTPGVKVFMNTRYLGEAPLSVTVPRVGFAIANLNTFSFEKDGYTKQEFKLNTELNYITLFNTISFTSYATDAWTGAITKYSPNEYHIMMLRKGQDTQSGVLYKKSIIQSYILINYYDLEENILAEGGVHIDNLSVLLNINELQRDDFISILKSATGSHKSPYDFLVGLNKSIEESSDFSIYAFM